MTSGEGSDWPLSRKYGCSTYEAVEVLTLADQLGLDAAGVSFHVGSQQRDPEAWARPIAASAHVFELLRGRGLHPRILDLGGGFPAAYEDGCRPVSAYGEAIERHLEQSFGTRRPQTMIEPGRGIVGDAGTLVSSVIGVVDRGGVRWVYLDAGVFTGLVETLDEAIRYRISTSADGARHRPVRAGRPDRATARTCSTRTGWCRSRSRSPRATRCGCCRPAPTPAATRPSGSTASLRCRPSCERAERPS